MTGEFQLAGDPLKAMDAATKHYVDQRVAGGASLIISDTPPVATSPGLMWFDSVGAQCYMWYSDANSSQWVPLNAPPALAAAVAYLPLAGGTMTGPVIQAADPVAALGTATKQYVDAGTAAAEHNVGRNLLHNSLFNIAQRGAGPFTAMGFYTLDRWALNGATDTVSIAQVTFSDAARSQVGDEATQFAMQNTFTGNAAAGASHNIMQPIENIRRLAGKTVTVSFWAATASGTLSLGVSYTQFFGAGGTPSPIVNGNGVAVGLTATWARYSVTLAIPSIIGKTVGTNGNDQTILRLWFSSGATNAAQAGNIGVQSGTIFLWGVQLEIGATATPLEKPDPQQDLAKCQRFYQYTGIVISGYVNAAAAPIYGSFWAPVQMRAIPTISFPGTIQYSNASGLIMGANTSTFMMQFNATVTAAGSASVVANVVMSADL
jgi:hypothetical protein